MYVFFGSALAMHVPPLACFQLSASVLHVFCELPSASTRVPIVWRQHVVHVVGSAGQCMCHLDSVADSIASLLHAVVSFPLSLRGCRLCGAAP